MGPKVLDVIRGLAEDFFDKKLPEYPSNPPGDAIRDLFEVAGFVEPTLLLDELDRDWDKFREKFEEQVWDMYGPTPPIRKVVESVNERFNKEFQPFDGVKPQSTLFLISDGEGENSNGEGENEKDGSLEDMCQRIEKNGTTIFSCLLSVSDLVAPRRLYDVPQPRWPKGAEVLFRCASIVHEGETIFEILRGHGWTVKDGDRLFFQFNEDKFTLELLDVLSKIRERLDTKRLIASTSTNDRRRI